MKIKLVAIDLDDTLLSSYFEIAPECIQCIQKVRAAGVYVTLATGRMFQAARPYAIQMGFDLPVISCQGALVQNVLTPGILYYRPISPAVACQVIHLLDECRIEYHIYTQEAIYATALSDYLKRQISATGIPPTLVPGLMDYARDGRVLEIMAVAKSDLERHQLMILLKGHMGDGIHMNPFKHHSLEIMHHEANKARALAVIAQKHKIPRQQVMAIGDGHNDLPMLQWAGISIAMANSTDEIKEAADFITFSNDELGVAAALEAFILNRQ